MNRLLSGHFRERTGYHIRRSQGTTDWLLIYTLAGSGEFKLALDPLNGPADRITTAPGEAVLLRPKTMHDYRVNPAVKRWDLLWAHFHPRPDWQAWLDWPKASPRSNGVMRLSLGNAGERKIVENALQKMNDLSVLPHPLNTSMAMNALEEALLWFAKGILRTSDHDSRVEEAEDYLCKHLRENVTLPELAEAVGLSVSRLAFLFKQQTGTTPQRYLETQRLERARQLLELTSMPIKSIAAEVGFENPFYFTSRFKRHAGKSPRAYRRI